MPSLGQVKQPRTGAVQARVPGLVHDRAMLEVLLCRGRHREEQVQHERHVESADRGRVVRFRAAPHGEKDKATNRGFRIREGLMMTYEQQKLGLSAYYHKRYTHPDGIHTELVGGLIRHGRGKFSIRQDNHQFFQDKATFWSVAKPIPDRLTLFDKAR